MQLTFEKSIARSDDVKSFIFQPESPLTWQAGQYLHYTLTHPEADDRGVKRWFTISSAPSEKYIMITTRLNAEHSSSFKTALQALQPGDTIEAEAPEGDFVIEDPARNLLFVAGGIGITPYRSMLVEAAAQGQQLHAKLLYANRNDQIVFKDELEALRDQNLQLAIDYVVDPQRLDEARLRSEIAAIDNPLIYVSGPEPMVKALAEQIAGLGVTKDNIKVDDFPGYEGL